MSSSMVCLNAISASSNLACHSPWPTKVTVADFSYSSSIYLTIQPASWPPFSAVSYLIGPFFVRGTI